MSLKMIERLKRRSSRPEEAIYRDVLGHLLFNDHEVSEPHLKTLFRIYESDLMKMVKRGILNIDIRNDMAYYYADNRNKRRAEHVYWHVKGGAPVKELNLKEYPTYLAARPIVRTTADGNKLSIIGARMERHMELLGSVTTPKGEVFTPWRTRTPLPITAYIDVERNINNIVEIKRDCKVIDIWD